MNVYFSILTAVGAAKLANATALGKTIELSKMALGDGGGSLPTPDQSQTELINEVRREALNSVEIEEDNPNWIICEQVIPADEGGWTIRELGIYDEDGDLIAVGNFPETYKPILEEGSGRTQTIRMVIQVSNAATVTLKIDPSIVLATREYVDKSSDDHLEDAKTYTDTKSASTLSAAKSDATTKANAALSSAKTYTDTAKASAISTASSDAATKANAALASAKTDATTKANAALASAKTYTDTAKASAISTASSDATTKANAALASAKTYTDTAKASAISTASSDATTKANAALASAKSHSNNASNLSSGTVPDARLPSDLARAKKDGQEFGDQTAFVGNQMFFGHDKEHNLFDNDGNGNAGMKLGCNKNVMTVDGGAVEFDSTIDGQSNPYWTISVSEGGQSIGDTVEWSDYQLKGKADGTLTWGDRDIASQIADYDVILADGMYASGTYSYPDGRTESDYVCIVHIGTNTNGSNYPGVIIYEDQIASTPESWVLSSAPESVAGVTLTAESETTFSIGYAGNYRTRQIIGYLKKGV